MKVGFIGNMLSELLLRVTEGTDFPILCNVDFGHTDPMITLPNGTLAEVVATHDTTRISLLEAAVEDAMMDDVGSSTTVNHGR